jgi:soluble lytic murein transglycosylase
MKALATSSYLGTPYLPRIFMTRRWKDWRQYRNLPTLNYVIANALGRWILPCLLILVAMVSPLQGDIYRWVDNEGTMHFTNVPTSSRYEVYIREAIPKQIHPSHRYDRYVEEAAGRYDVPVSLIKAIIKAESDFDPNAVSRSGAQGLMQLMPETAKDLGVSDAFNPRDNILGGVRYFKGLLEQFHGSIPLALAAYNAGPNRIGPLREVPRIEETERFVRRVMEYFYNY